ncbi:hypothetical protein [Streptomyces sp. NPDC001492]
MSVRPTRNHPVSDRFRPWPATAALLTASAAAVLVQAGPSVRSHVARQRSGVPRALWDDLHRDRGLIRQDLDVPTTVGGLL